MKKTILTATLSIMTLIAFSQAKLEVGLKAGANFSNIDVNDASNTDGITAFHGGAYLLVKAASFGIQPEVLVSKQGYGLSGLGDVSLDYINVPVMVKFYLPLGLNLQAGPQFGILTTAEASDGTDIKDTLKGSDLSAAIGAGWDLPFGLQVSARYVLGLSDVNDVATSTTEIKNRTFQVAVGYSLFKLGK